MAAWEAGMDLILAPFSPCGEALAGHALGPIGVGAPRARRRRVQHRQLVGGGRHACRDGLLTLLPVPVRAPLPAV